MAQPPRTDAQPIPRTHFCSSRFHSHSHDQGGSCGVVFLDVIHLGRRKVTFFGVSFHSRAHSPFEAKIVKPKGRGVTVHMLGSLDTPVCPKPPAPRCVESRSSTSWTSGELILSRISCPIRSPGRTGSTQPPAHPNKRPPLRVSPNSSHHRKTGALG